MENDKKYFNFPVVLLRNFLEDSDYCLNNILHYSLHAYSLKVDPNTNEDIYEAAIEFFKVELGNREYAEEQGELIFDSIPEGTPTASISLLIFWDYYNNKKTEFQKVTLLAFTAIRSILGNKTYCCITNNFLLSRMDGKATSVGCIEELHPMLISYTTRYKIDKIKSELVNNWKLKTYGYYTRGYYVSFKLDLEALITKVEQKRPAFLEKDRKVKEAVLRARVRENMYTKNQHH